MTKSILDRLSSRQYLFRKLESHYTAKLTPRELKKLDVFKERVVNKNTHIHIQIVKSID